MTNGGLTHSVEAGLLGVEIGRNKVRLVLLDKRATQLGDAVERPIAKAGGPRDPIEQEFSTRSAIEAGIDRLDIEDLSSLAVGATIGFPNCGVGSGPALQQWLESLSQELDEPVLYTGNSGISYAPVSCVDFVQRVFEPTGLRLGRVELAPVAAARVLTSVRSGAITLGSGVAWSARLLNNQVLEAFETADGGFDDELQIMVNGAGESIVQLDGFDYDHSFGPARGLSPAALAPAVGVAVAMLDPDGPNLLIAPNAAGAKADVVRQSFAGGQEAPVEQAQNTMPDPQAEVWEELAPVGPDDVLAEPPPVDAHIDNHANNHPGVHQIDDPFAQPMEPQVDDLGMIQNELRASRGADDTYRLARAPRNIERSRELREAQPMSPERAGVGGDRLPGNGFDQIEAFAHPNAAPGANGFHVSDFILGALLMLAIVLAIALVIL